MEGNGIKKERVRKRGGRRGKWRFVKRGDEFVVETVGIKCELGKTKKKRYCGEEGVQDEPA